MLSLYSKAHKISREKYELDEPPTEFFPGPPLHSEQKKFKVDFEDMWLDNLVGRVNFFEICNLKKSSV